MEDDTIQLRLRLSTLWVRAVRGEREDDVKLIDAVIQELKDRGVLSEPETQEQLDERA